MASTPKKSRLSNGGSAHNPDVVAFFPHNKPRKVDDLRLEEHEVQPGEKAYTVEGYASNSSSIFEVGREVLNEEDGMDYCIAVVNKRTGEVKMKPARLVSFQAVYGEDLEEAIGKKRRNRSDDYAKDYGLKKEAWWDAKKELSMQFAGTKKLRMLEAAKRREINDSTLEEMRKTAFASESTMLKAAEEAKREAEIDEKISLLDKAESEVLPKFVDAELAKDVYPLKLFVNENDITECAAECGELWKKKREELEGEGVLKCVHEIYKQMQRSEGTLVGVTLLAAMAGTLKKFSRGSIKKEDYDALKLPVGVKQKLRLEYLQGQWRQNGRGAGRGESLLVTKTTQERMLAYSLCLAVTLTPSLSIPITPWARSLNIPEHRVVKTLTALGCTVFNLPAAEAIKYESIRAARLLCAPKEAEGRKRRSRR